LEREPLVLVLFLRITQMDQQDRLVHLRLSRFSRLAFVVLVAVEQLPQLLLEVRPHFLRLSFQMLNLALAGQEGPLGDLRLQAITITLCLAQVVEVVLVPPPLQQQTHLAVLAVALRVEVPQGLSQLLLVALEERLPLLFKHPLALPQQPNICLAAQVEVVAFIKLLRLAERAVQEAGRVVGAVGAVPAITASQVVQAVQAPTASRSSSPIANDYAIHRP
jgi:hypothetical protein